MRIVGGRLGGRPLRAPRSAAVRPTSDRLRGAVFNLLAHARWRPDGDPVPGARVLDLFAGTGAMALEALSRGAAHATLVDDGAEARGLIRANVEALGLAGVARVLRRDATRMGALGPEAPFTLVFCDPPYGRDLAPRALASCRAGGWLAPGALAVVEEVRGATVGSEGFETLDARDYGETTLTILRAAPPGGPAGDDALTLR